MMKLFFFISALVGVSAIVFPPRIQCPSLAQTQNHYLIKRVQHALKRESSSLNLYVQLLHDDCVNLDLLIKKNHELSNIFADGKDQTPALVHAMVAIFNSLDKDNDGIVNTQVAAIAQASLYLTASNIADAGNLGFEHFVDVYKAIIVHITRHDPKLRRGFGHRIQKLNRVVAVRDIARQEPFNGLRLFNGTVRILQNPIRHGMNPAKVFAGIQRLFREARIPEYTAPKVINDKNVKFIEMLGSVLNYRAVSNEIIGHITAIFAAYEKYDLGAVYRHTSHFAKDIKDNYKLTGSQRIALDSQLEIINYAIGRAQPSALKITTIRATLLTIKPTTGASSTVTSRAPRVVGQEAPIADDSDSDSSAASDSQSQED